MNSKFDVLFLEDARQFLLELDDKTRAKILYNIDKSKVWTKYNGLQYRLLAFWDKTEKTETLVVSTHGFVKKVDKVPSAEINRAEQLRQLYFDQKKRGK